MPQQDTVDPRWRILPTRPGKVLAVHLSYASRAAQRGRTPDAPSYFFKATSSIAATGGQIERPVGTELLSFEGEIALVIGRDGRRVPLAEAWAHVGWVTAANDFGLYDLRAADHGSNVRSKSGDGFTPLGPTLLEAAGLDPAGLRVRTWVDGALAQEGSTADLLFPLAQIVADLSQHLTLEVGDVILTGTPSGSTIVEPGSVVEVEVDHPVDGRTTGRLVTTVVAGSGPGYDASLGSTPSVDDAQRAAARGTVTPATPTGPAVPMLSATLRDKLHRAPTASLSSQLRRRGLDHVTIDGVHPLPGAGKIVGVARTLRFVPHREDLFAEHGGGYNAQKRAFDSLRPGDVMVIGARGDAGAGTLGDVLALRARTLGAAGIVTDGAVRDSAAVAAMALPVFAAGTHPAVLGRRHVPWDADLTISCGGAAVQPGDVIVGDADGVLVIPPALAEEVADAALAQEDSDAYIAARVAEGEPLDGLFPMNERWRARYQAQGETP